MNLVAELVNGGQAAAVPDALQAAGVAARDSMEVAFNAACASLATGALEDADFLLEQALAVGKEVLAEEEGLAWEVSRCCPAATAACAEEECPAEEAPRCCPAAALAVTGAAVGALEAAR